MYSGNMGLCQALDQVVEAADCLRHRTDVSIVMVGDGASRARLEQAARDRQLTNIRFLPYQPHADLAISLSAADLQLVPLDARVTGCLVPSKLYGILAAGVPALVIADARSEAARVVREAEVGQVVPPTTSPRWLPRSNGVPITGQSSRLSAAAPAGSQKPNTTGSKPPIVLVRFWNKS